MDRQEIEDLVEDLAGDEHTWVDFKVDYEIGGIAPKKAEFIKDVNSLSNTITEQNEHYIIIGVSEEDGIVGIASGKESYSGSGPRHIFSYDESDIQEILDSNLDPSPITEWHTFRKDGNKFGILVVKPLPEPPSIISQDINDSSGNRLLHQGLIFVRKGSGKKIADSEELERIIRYRIECQREQILEGIHRAIDIGPEWIDRIGKVLPDEPGLPLATTDDPDQANIEVTQRLTREPASTLDEQLNEDISQWMSRGDDFIEIDPLYQYYGKSSKLHLDEVAIKFLTQSSIKHDNLGVFWLTNANKETQQEAILETPNYHHRIERAAKVLLIMGDDTRLDNLLYQNQENAKYGDLRMCKQMIGNELQSRVDKLVKTNEYSLNHDGWTRDFCPGDMEAGEIRGLIPEVAKQLRDLQNRYENRQPGWGKRDEFKDALWDLEVILGARLLN